MKLNIQFFSLGFSFIYGCIFYFLLDLFNKFIRNHNFFYKVIFSFLFTFFLTLLYFYGMLNINNGYIHIYFLVSILVGYFFVYFILNKMFTYLSKKK